MHQNQENSFRGQIIDLGNQFIIRYHKDFCSKSETIKIDIFVFTEIGNNNRNSSKLLTFIEERVLYYRVSKY